MFLENGTEVFDYVRVGGWDSGNLTIDKNRVFWPNPGGQRSGHVVESVCSKPCPKGEVKVRGQGRAGQGRAGQGRAGQGRAGQGRAGQGRAGQVKYWAGLARL